MDTKTVIHPNDSVKESLDTSGAINVAVDTNLKVGVLFDNPEVDDQFEITQAALIERKTMQLGNWVLYDMPKDLVFDHIQSNGNRKFIMSLRS